MVEVRREGDRVVLTDGETSLFVAVGDVPALVRSLARELGQGDQVVSELVTVGVDPFVARQLSTSVTLQQVRLWRRYIDDQAHGLNNPAGFLVARLRSGEWPPDQSRRWLAGEYGDLVET